LLSNNKIAIVSTSLALGGAERFSSLLSFMLDDLGYEVHTIIINDQVAYPYKGILINLGSICSNQNVLSRKINKGKFVRKYLEENNINLIIDNRSRPIFIRELFVKSIYLNKKIFFMVHSSALIMYLPKLKMLAHYLYNNSQCTLVAVSNSISQKIKDKLQLANVSTIYNPVEIVTTKHEKTNDLPEHYFLYFGRFEEEIKNFTLLIESYHISKARYSNFHLLLIGQGRSKVFIENKVNELELNNFIHILPFQSNVVSYIQQAHCTLLTSRFEGFPMSIIESLAAGTPVISVDCETGPNEIIQNEQNGLLVENHNKEALANAMNRFVSDTVLYQNCKKNAQKSVEHLSLKNISLQWKKLLS
jgi:glycosyltransferase involved in cell wall biosynthesis